MTSNRKRVLLFIIKSIFWFSVLMILLSLFWRTSLFVASLYYSFSIHLVFNALSFFCRSLNCHISPQLPPLPLAHPPSRHLLPNSPVPLLHPDPSADYSSSLSSLLLVPSGNSSSSILLLCRHFGHFLFANTVSLSSFRSFLPRHCSWSRRQYEPLYVIVHEVFFALRSPLVNASSVSPFRQLSPYPLFLLFLYNLAHQSHSYTVLLYLLFAPYRLSLSTY